MNAEYLLDAIGQLDDELVREAERYRRPKVRYGRVLGLAASFALVIALGYVLTHVGGMNGGSAPSLSAGGSSSAPAGGGSAASGDNSGAPRSEDSAFDPQSPGETALASGEDVPNSDQTAVPGTIFVRGGQDSGTYILTGEVLAEPPEGAEPFGELSALYPDSPSPYTDVEEYVGLNLWAEDGDVLYAVYVELPEGGFARAELAEP